MDLLQEIKSVESHAYSFTELRKILKRDENYYDR